MKRARDHGVIIGRFEPGALNAVTDVPGVLVGHATVVRDDTPGVQGSKAVRTGVTAVWPHDAEPAPAEGTTAVTGGATEP